MYARRGVFISGVNLYKNLAKCPYYRGVLVSGLFFKRDSTVDLFGHWHNALVVATGVYD